MRNGFRTVGLSVLFALAAAAGRAGEADGGDWSDPAVRPAPSAFIAAPVALEEPARARLAAGLPYVRVERDPEDAEA